jgi:hypothetical protein
VRMHQASVQACDCWGDLFMEVDACWICLCFITFHEFVGGIFFFFFFNLKMQVYHQGTCLSFVVGSLILLPVPRWLGVTLGTYCWFSLVFLLFLPLLLFCHLVSVCWSPSSLSLFRILFELSDFFYPGSQNNGCF